jgi:N-acetylglucosamine malate deacetylase 1
MTASGSTAPRLLCIGAHPDDCEIKSSGLAALWTANGGTVRFLALTDGSAGHQELAGGVLARSRRAEAQAGAAAVGADSVILDNPDGTLMPTLENRYKVIRAIREFQPDVIATHRINDYHPDHRYTGVLVQDSCYMVMVPNVVPNAPVPPREPVVLFMSDRFTKPYELQPDLVFDLDGVIEKKLDAIASHNCQMTEWMPWVRGDLDQVPSDPDGQRAYVREHAAREPEDEANRWRAALVAKYGEDRGASVKHAEAYEISEYAAPLTEDGLKTFFPF